LIVDDDEEKWLKARFQNPFLLIFFVQKSQKLRSSEEENTIKSVFQKKTG
jgi:hypothetical protein